MRIQDDQRFLNNTKNYSYLTTGVLHTIEHLFAALARNSQYKDGVIYVGPMGCRTGFHFLTRGLTDAEVLKTLMPQDMRYTYYLE